MPIEIRELVIRTEVDAGKKASVPAGSANHTQDDVVQEAVDKVLEVINQKNER